MANGAQERDPKTNRRSIVLEGRIDGDGFSFKPFPTDGVKDQIRTQQTRLAAIDQPSEDDVIATLAEMSARSIATRADDLLREDSMTTVPSSPRRLIEPGN
jgi:hypothetical protein